MSELPLRPAGHTAVMANRAPVSPEDLDYFPTPPWAARAGAELILRVDPDARSVWDPACGGGHMCHGLSDFFEFVMATDIHDHGGPWRPCAVADFLSEDWAAPNEDGWIVTNPPFKLAEAFVRTGLKRAQRGVAMLVRTAFLEGAGRHRLFSEHRPALVAQFAERVPMVKGRWDPEASSATAYCWILWRVPDAEPRPSWEVGGLTALDWIPPGSKARLTRQSDALFAAQGPLLEAAR